MYLEIGDKAPNFSLLNYNGDTITLNDLKGKDFVLWFFPKASTPGWTVEGKGFREEFEEYKKLGYEIIGVSGDAPSKQKKFVEKFDFPFRLLSVIVSPL